MDLAINEIKTQAKKLLKALRADINLMQMMRLPLKKVAVSSPSELKLKHCLGLVAIELGFKDWHEAQQILSGTKPSSTTVNMGSYFYPKSCGGFINEWFAEYSLAEKTLLKSSTSKWLLPYKNQFIVVEHDYIAVFKLDKDVMPLWKEVKHDMVASYNSLAWDKIACAVIRHRPKNY
ncbi:hypothetical protein [Colwellia psychrerythraea]|uniref:Uncharacterized protein n=1 Tax=Colwellia psychrerythraea TaxID=28229 RepID=A0A099KI96_COLPS|nr:hypothetical protein [Colwellia psychrerythraea]KGJ89702.1 hypothetical protein GAB14E_3863 [Colwellia psychrerythraea]